MREVWSSEGFCRRQKSTVKKQRAVKAAVIAVWSVVMTVVVMWGCNICMIWKSGMPSESYQEAAVWYAEEESEHEARFEDTLYWIACWIRTEYSEMGEKLWKYSVGEPTWGNVLHQGLFDIALTVAACTIYRIKAVKKSIVRDRFRCNWFARCNPLLMHSGSFYLLYGITGIRLRRL